MNDVHSVREADWMLTLRTGISLLCVASCLVCGCTQHAEIREVPVSNATVGAKTQAVEAKPRMIVSPLVIDAGAPIVGVEQTSILTIKNEGNATGLFQVAPTVMRGMHVSEDGGEIAPGESVDLEVQYRFNRPTENDQLVLRAFEILTNDRNAVRVVIHVAGRPRSATK